MSFSTLRLELHKQHTTDYCCSTGKIMVVINAGTVKDVGCYFLLFLIACFD